MGRDFFEGSEIVTANTRETLGEQATLDGLVSHILTELEEDGVTRLHNYALYDQSQITALRFPNLVNIGSHSFFGCSSLAHLVLGANSVASYSNLSAFSGTPILRGAGAVYVPQSQLNAYKANGEWGCFCILPTSAYPASTFETTSETWAQIEANGGENLVVGDRKSVLFGQTSYMAVLVGKQKDTLVGGGKANMTWMLQDAHLTHRYNATATTEGGYAASELRTYINEDILPTFELKDLVKQVAKVSNTYESGAPVKNGQTSNEKLWIPSAQEMLGSYYETDGCTYSDYFRSATARIKKSGNGGDASYWLRTIGGAATFMYINNSGTMASSNATYNSNIVLGFCL